MGGASRKVGGTSWVGRGLWETEMGSSEGSGWSLQKGAGPPRKWAGRASLVGRSLRGNGRDTLRKGEQSLRDGAELSGQDAGEVEPQEK